MKLIVIGSMSSRLGWNISFWGRVRGQGNRPEIIFMPWLLDVWVVIHALWTVICECYLPLWTLSRYPIIHYSGPVEVSCCSFYWLHPLASPLPHWQAFHLEERHRLRARTPALTSGLTPPLWTWAASISTPLSPSPGMMLVQCARWCQMPHWLKSKQKRRWSSSRWNWWW